MSSMVEAGTGRGVPASAAARPARPGALSSTLTFAWRAVQKVRRDPTQILEALGVPVMFTLVFGFLFGGALAGSTSSYMQFYIPGIVVFTGIMISMRIGAVVNLDNSREVTDRFRALAIWRPAAIVGTLLGNNVLYVVGCAVAVAVGLAVGFRPDGGVLGVLATILITLVFVFSFSWVYVVFGLALKSPTAALSACQAIVFPVSFVSNFFVPQETLPGWLQAVVGLNPFALTVTAARGLAHGTATAGEVGAALAGCAALVAVFAPLSMFLYRRRA